MGTTNESVRSWVTIYVTDRLLNIAFGGSVKQAVHSCKSLAGVEYGEIASEVLAAAQAFEITIANAAKFLVGSQWSECEHALTVNKDGTTGVSGQRRVRFKSEQHRASLVCAYGMFEALNSRVDTVRSGNIMSEEELRQWLHTAFDNIDDLVHICTQAAETLRAVACAQLNAAIKGPTTQEIELPNGLLGAKIKFLSKAGNQAVEIWDAKHLAKLATVAANAVITMQLEWGYTFIAIGTFSKVEFAD
jgi:hypothetical protein